MNNEQEWRALLLSEIAEIKKDLKEVRSEMLTLKLRVAAFSSVIGSVVSYFWNKYF